MNSYLQKYSATGVVNSANDGSRSHGCTQYLRATSGGCHNWVALILIALLVWRPTIADVSFDHTLDFDEDGVTDQLDLDQDNDGILNSDEGYVSFANLADYPAESFILLPDTVVTASQQAASQSAGSVFRYPLLNGRGIPSVEFVGTIERTDTLVDWAVQQQLPKLKHLGAGRSEVHWQFVRFGTDEQMLVDVDLTIADLDGSRSESVTVSLEDIAGYSVSVESNLQINDAVAGKVVFTANGVSDNTENDAVVLHLRNVSALNITYSSQPNINVLPGLDNDAAGFRHNFTAGALDNYVPAPVVLDTDNDGYPDHQDLDSNNDGLPDADAGVDKNRDGMVDGPVDANGVPAPYEVVADEGAPTSEPPIEQLAEQTVEQLPEPVSSAASATLNIVSDLDRDSISDRVEGLGDADGDGVPNQYDLDSDNDGLADLVEAGGIDADNNGVIDDAPDTLVKTYTTIVPDFDNDGVPDFLDSDSDQDTLFDLVEAGGEDLDANGVIDGLIDQNGDGWDDRFLANPLPLPDSDNDGNPDTLDNDPILPVAVVLEDFQQLTEDVSINSDIVTGGAAGCALRTGPQAMDPMLWVLLLVLQFYYWKRRVVPNRRRIIDASTQ